MTSLVELRGISRRFDETVALDDVSLEIRAGEILCLLGENGAGKTTLMRIAAGVDAPSSGEIVVERHPFNALTPSAAKRAGIAIVHQHFLLVPEMTIAENLAIAHETTPFLFGSRAINDAAFDAARASGIHLGDITRKVAALSVGEMSRVEMVKALRDRPRVLILDEPTSVLSPPEVEELAAVLRRLAAAGTAIVLITHKLAEVFSLADRVAILRRGKLVRVSKRDELTPRELARLMTGERARERVAARHRGETLLELEHVASADGAVTDASLEVAAGEMVSIVGVAGNGQRELAMLLRGLVDHAGSIRFAGARLDRVALSEVAKIAHVPADRSSDGIFGDLSVEENLAVGQLARGSLFSSKRLQRARAEAAIESFSIRTSGASQRVGALSGGNQQKVILARELAREPEFIVASEPTRGLDLDATAFVHERLRQVTASGAGALLITSDLDEALELSDAIHVIYRGRTGERLERPFSRGEIGERMAGLR